MAGISLHISSYCPRAVEPVRKLTTGYLPRPCALAFVYLPLPSRSYAAYNWLIGKVRILLSFDSSLFSWPCSLGRARLGLRPIAKMASQPSRSLTEPNYLSLDLHGYHHHPWFFWAQTDPTGGTVATRWWAVASAGRFRRSARSF